MQKFQFLPRAIVLSVFSLIGLNSQLSAASFSNVVISFDEPAFPTVATDVSGEVSFNVINDLTGSKIATSEELSAMSGDQSDLLFDFTNTPTANGSASWQWQATSSGRFTATQALATTGTVNNPGDLISSTLTLTFGSHLVVDDLSFTGTSFNTNGVAWEYAVIEFFKPDGSSFSDAPEISPYLDHTSINGSPSTGWFVIDSTQTVLDVGTDKTTNSGVSGEYNTLSGGIGYDDVGLAEGTEIGGIRITAFLEDVRGTSNGSSSFTSSITSITISGTTVPEPSTSALIGMASICLWTRRRPHFRSKDRDAPNGDGDRQPHNCKPV
jgi:hypothetical protein